MGIVDEMWVSMDEMLISVDDIKLFVLGEKLRRLACSKEYLTLSLLIWNAKLSGGCCSPEGRSWSFNFGATVPLKKILFAPGLSWEFTPVILSLL